MSLYYSPTLLQEYMFPEIALMLNADLMIQSFKRTTMLSVFDLFSRTKTTDRY